MKKLISAGDAKSWKHCQRRVWFDHNPPADFRAEEDAFELLVQQAGDEHEQRIKTALEAYGDVVEAHSVEHTKALMAAKTAVIFQPVAIDVSGTVIGKPDFLVLTETGDYQVADAKLALSMKGRSDLEIQLGLYRQLFDSKLPALVYLGSGEIAEVDESSDSKVETFLDSMRALLAQPSPPLAHYGFSKCGVCPYHDICLPAFEAQGDLPLLYGVDPRAVPGLQKQGISTIAKLAEADPLALQDVPYFKGAPKKERLVKQAQSYLSGEMHVVAPIELPSGTWVHFDVEANPLPVAGNEVYLWGLLEPDYETANFQYTWSDGDQAGDYRAWCEFLDKVEDYRQQYPDLVLAHFANYEVTQIKTYAMRYDMLEDARVEWLLGDDSPLFDMRDVLTQSLVLPLKSYGLKAVCKAKNLVNFQWELSESGSQWSVVRYVDYLKCADSAEREAIKQEILTYNRDDVKATRALELWLRSLQAR